MRIKHNKLDAFLALAYLVLLVFVAGLVMFPLFLLIRYVVMGIVSDDELITRSILGLVLALLLSVPTSILYEEVES